MVNRLICDRWWKTAPTWCPNTQNTKESRADEPWHETCIIQEAKQTPLYNTTGVRYERGELWASLHHVSRPDDDKLIYSARLSNWIKTITCLIKQAIAHEHDLVQSNCNIFLKCLKCIKTHQKMHLLLFPNTTGLKQQHCFHFQLYRHQNNEQDRNINSR